MTSFSQMSRIIRTLPCIHPVRDTIHSQRLSHPGSFPLRLGASSGGRRALVVLQKSQTVATRPSVRLDRFYARAASFGVREAELPLCLRRSARVGRKKQDKAAASLPHSKAASPRASGLRSSWRAEVAAPREVSAQALPFIDPGVSNAHISHGDAEATERTAEGLLSCYSYWLSQLLCVLLRALRVSVA